MAALEEILERLRGVRDMCMSGGAEGADLEWGKYANAIGHDVVHWSFAEHHSLAPENQLVRLTDEELQSANAAVQNAAVALGKSPPRRPAVARFIQRNYYEIAWSEACYAVTVIQENPASIGGTAWATTMFAQMHPTNRNLYLFDQEKNGWFQFTGETWVLIDSPPRPRGVWAGIGSRNLKQNGKDAIRKLMTDYQ